MWCVASSTTTIGRYQRTVRLCNWWLAHSECVTLCADTQSVLRSLARSVSAQLLVCAAAVPVRTDSHFPRSLPRIDSAARFCWICWKGVVRRKHRVCLEHFPVVRHVQSAGREPAASHADPPLSPHQVVNAIHVECNARALLDMNSSSCSWPIVSFEQQTFKQQNFDFVRVEKLPGLRVGIKTGLTRQRAKGHNSVHTE
jgi:hypothetical protein